MGVWNFFRGKNNVILTGESGCGKTEIALHLAKCFSAGRAKVRLIDMDQTKSMFRSRDFEGAKSLKAVEFLCGAHFMDMPLVPAGMVEKLTDTSGINILDVGGNETGSVSLGQFSEWLQGETAQTFYVINPYRNLSGRLSDIRRTMDQIIAFGRLKEPLILCNPNLGPYTRDQDVREGIERLSKVLKKDGMSIDCVAVPDWTGISEDIFGLPVLRIAPMIYYP